MTTRRRRPRSSVQADVVARSTPRVSTFLALARTMTGRQLELLEQAFTLDLKAAQERNDGPAERFCYRRLVMITRVYTERAEGGLT